MFILLETLLGSMYASSLLAFIIMCANHYGTWDLFQAKGEFEQFIKGRYLHQITFHWYEIELVSIASKVLYSIISYHFFLNHRNKKGTAAESLKD